MTGWSVLVVMGCIVCVSLTTTLHTRATDGREEGKWHWGRRSINIIITVLAPEFLQKYFSFLQIFYTLEEIIANLSALIVLMYYSINYVVYLKNMHDLQGT